MSAGGRGVAARRRVAVALACAFAWCTAAFGAAVPAARELRLTAGERVVVPIPGATAAIAVDEGIVEATASGGDVTLVGRRGGRTVVSVIAGITVTTLRVTVEAPVARAVTASARPSAQTGGVLEGRYDSGTGRLGSSLSVTAGSDARAVRLRLHAVDDRDGAPDGGALRSLPSASLEMVAGERSLVLLDELVEASPLTLDGTVLRGIHLRDGALAIHAGIASATPWDDLLLPADGDRALGASYRLDFGGIRLVPAALWLPDAPGETPGVLSLGLERGEPGEPVALRAELGWGGEPGAAVDLSFRGPRHQGWLEGLYRPHGFAALGVARTPGTFVDGAWALHPEGRTSLDLAVSASDVDLPGQRREAASVRAEARHRLDPRWTLEGGLAAGVYRADGGASAERLAWSGGLRWDRGAHGAALRYRWQESSLAARGGHGGRLTLRTGRGGFRARLHLDAQEEAPTVAVLFAAIPGLERAFAELGFAAVSPEEAVALLRDNGALLAAEGISLGALELDPLRLRAGLDLSWRGDGPAHLELGLRLTGDEARGVASRRRSYLATLSASRRLFGDTDLLLAWSRWSLERTGGTGEERSSLEVALRTRLSEADLLGGGRAIRGSVRRDDAATGVVSRELPPLGGVEVVLDDGRRTRTDEDGRFAFRRPGRGPHAVSVVLPETAGSYFTTASRVEAGGGDELAFGVAVAAARLAGRVTSDAGAPIAGAVVRLAGASVRTATTDSAGAFVLHAPPGDGWVEVVPESLPAGYDAAVRPVAVRLAPGEPVTIGLAVRAQRAVAGRVEGPDPAAVEVGLAGGGATVRPGPDGAFVLRGVPAGRLTLVARAAGSAAARGEVDVPAEPGVVRDVVLTVP